MALAIFLIMMLILNDCIQRQDLMQDKLYSMLVQAPVYQLFCNLFPFLSLETLPNVIKSTTICEIR
jgi:hypothetical protein